MEIKQELNLLDIPDKELVQLLLLLTVKTGNLKQHIKLVKIWKY